jgi:hypothetical protein
VPKVVRGRVGACFLDCHIACEKPVLRRADRRMRFEQLPASGENEANVAVAPIPAHSLDIAAQWGGDDDETLALLHE